MKRLSTMADRVQSQLVTNMRQVLELAVAVIEDICFFHIMYLPLIGSKDLGFEGYISGLLRCSVRSVRITCSDNSDMLFADAVERSLSTRTLTWRNFWHRARHA